MGLEGGTAILECGIIRPYAMENAMYKERECADLVRIQIQDPFWDKYTQLVSEVVLPYQWRILNDELPDVEPSHALRNFRIAAGEEEGDFYGFVFQDSDVAKWLEAAACSLAGKKDPQLEQKADNVIELLGRAQKKNGYLDTYYMIAEGGQEFTNLREGHELYCAGHLIEAGVAWYKATGKRNLLEICTKMADHIVEEFHTERLSRAIPGHEEIELALIKLYEVIGQESYLDMACEFLDRRGRVPHFFMEEQKRKGWKQIFTDQTGEGYHLDYSQTDEPVRRQKTARGHAVRAVYLYSAMADAAYYKKDPELLEACGKLYQNIVSRQMYITGGIGSSGFLERFTTDYDLPNASGYAESCASIGLALFCRRMAQITGEARYMDTAETAIYNTVLAGIAMDGKSFFYVNPLAVWPHICMEGTSRSHVKSVRQKWFGCACCPPNIARTLASLGEYAFFVTEEGFWVNFFLSGKFEFYVGGSLYEAEARTGYPFDGRYELSLHRKGTDGNTRNSFGEIRFRIPSHVRGWKLFCRRESGMFEQISCSVDKGYAVLSGEFSSNETIAIEFDMPARFVHADPRVRADAGRVALVKGPLVYCLEEIDNGKNLEQLLVDPKEVPKEIFDDKLLQGTLKLSAKGYRCKEKGRDSDVLYDSSDVVYEKTDLTFIPYAYWGNRAPGEMIVWVRERQYIEDCS